MMGIWHTEHKRALAEPELLQGFGYIVKTHIGTLFGDGSRSDSCGTEAAAHTAQQGQVLTANELKSTTKQPADLADPWTGKTSTWRTVLAHDLCRVLHELRAANHPAANAPPGSARSAGVPAPS